MFYELDLPVAFPVLQLVLAGYRSTYFNSVFIPDQVMQLILGGEAWYSICFVFVNASYQIIGDADIQSAISLAGHDVHERHC